ncbi:MAG: hypothetical protein EOP86_16740 [Verrucomicrobiaceae bacterium]|nr:MAG: hypothetical protein EOP86_16740 [Verrucomicrobiaceae bacterium]
MKRAVFLILSLLMAGVPLSARAQARDGDARTTGKGAMRIVARDRRPEYLSNILHLIGERGVDQPPVWRVIARDDRGAVREFYVGKGAVLSDGILPPKYANGFSSTPLPMHRLNIDSNAAFLKAEAAAQAARIGFDSVNYQLRCLELSNNAAWFLTLLNAKGERVGEVSIGASTGTVIAQNWFRTPVPQAPKNWDKTRASVQRGTENVKNGMNNTVGWIRRKVAPAPAPPPYYIPPSR